MSFNTDMNYALMKIYSKGIYLSDNLVVGDINPCPAE